MRRSRKNPFVRWDWLLLRVAAGCVAILLASQLIRLSEGPRRHLSRVDRLEGEPATLQMPYYASAPGQENAPVVNRIEWLREHKTITVRMIQPQQHAGVHVTVNGKRAGDFRRGQVELTVYEGDYLEIDAGALRQPGRFVVNAPEGGVAAPADGLALEGQGEAIPIGKVKFKR